MTGHELTSITEESPIFVVFNIPDNIAGEQWFFSLVNGISSRLWLYRYGRVEMGCVGSSVLAEVR
jgi:hypothetical protein